MQFKLKHGAGFLKNSALHYLCRASNLNSVNAFDFYSLHEVVYVTKKNRDEVNQFIATKHFKHPSLTKNMKRSKQASQLREQPHLLKLHQWLFCDAADFDGNILDPNTAITAATEQQSRFILLLFLPYRSNDDLLLNGSHTQKLRQAFRLCKLASKALAAMNITVQNYLQNLQDSRANCTRHKPPQDQLTRETLPYISAEEIHPDIILDDDEDYDDEETELPPEEIDAFLDTIFDSSPPQNPNAKPTSLDLQHLQSRSKHTSSRNHITTGGDIPKQPVHLKSFIRVAGSRNNNSSDNASSKSCKQNTKKKPMKRDIIKTIARYTRIRHRKQKFFGRNMKVKLQDANGTAKSIICWARAFKLDSDQRRAFEVLASSFVLTFFDDASLDSTQPNGLPTFLSEHDKLKELSGKINTNASLIAFIHGPGGSGKTAVIDLVKIYCEEFCTHLGHPFTSNTIVVTALTGSAATLLLGETTHRALALNYRRISGEHTLMWKDTRLLVIDEISFASPQIIAKIDTNLRTLLSQQGKKFGGLNIVFSGDLSQLKAINQDSIIDKPCPQFDKWVNCYIELHGLHRFDKDPAWGRLLTRF